MGRIEEASWSELGSLDPKYAVASRPDKRGGGWNDDEFFRAGEEIVAGRLARFQTLDYGSALDFGCGLGRLTQPLARRFGIVVGIDVSRVMVERARAAAPNIDFRLETSPALESIAGERFDFILAHHVLQHVGPRPELLAYLQGLVSRLAPKGCFAFNVPTSMVWWRRLQPRRRLYRLGRRLTISPDRLYQAGLTPIRMTAVPPHRVLELVGAAGCRVEAIDRIDYENGVVGHYFYVRRYESEED